MGESDMFNYYNRIASLANEYELDGLTEKAERLRLILENENRCEKCGRELIVKETQYICIGCNHNKSKVG